LQACKWGDLLDASAAFILFLGVLDNILTILYHYTGYNIKENN